MGDIIQQMLDCTVKLFGVKQIRKGLMTFILKADDRKYCALFFLQFAWTLQHFLLPTYLLRPSPLMWITASKFDSSAFHAPTPSSAARSWPLRLFFTFHRHFYHSCLVCVRLASPAGYEEFHESPSLTTSPSGCCCFLGESGAFSGIRERKILSKTCRRTRRRWASSPKVHTRWVPVWEEAVNTTGAFTDTRGEMPPVIRGFTVEAFVAPVESDRDHFSYWTCFKFVSILINDLCLCSIGLILYQSEQDTCFILLWFKNSGMESGENSSKLSFRDFFLCMTMVPVRF